VLIARQYAYRGAELVVIPQPDGSVACIPAWMTHESAGHHQLRAEPRLPLDILRYLRAEIEALLGFLHSDTGMENAHNEAQERKHSGGLVRAGRARILPALSQKEQLATLVEALLFEIAVALANGEVGDDQDHGLSPRPRRFRIHPPVDGRSASAQSGEPAAVNRSF
jgi:hypothetical protein